MSESRGDKQESFCLPGVTVGLMALLSGGHQGVNEHLRLGLGA